MRREPIGLLVVVATLVACNLAESSEEVSAPDGGTTANGPGGASVAGSSATSGEGTTGAGGGSGGAFGTGGAGGSGNGIETPGTVACGPLKCDLAQEVCCPDGANSVCAPTPDACPAPTGKLPYGPLSCDDTADCSGGQQCCVQQGLGGLTNECASAPCDVHESCILGGNCVPGFQCVPDPSSPTGARCVGDGAAVGCDNATCSPPNGVCCIAKNTEMCAAFGSGCTSTLECDDSADCGTGYECCGSGSPAELIATCQAAGSCAGVVLCATLADCAGGMTCDPPSSAGYPPSVKLCQ